MDETDYGLPKYPMLKRVVRHGDLAGLGIALLVLLGGVAVAVALESLVVGGVAVILAALAYVLSRILVELVRLITDMLLPQ